ncbi:hypothetical protein GO290_01930 [Ralstonia solanacearum]|nr:hypothetical protein [Ralstonia solanacearum]
MCLKYFSLSRPTQYWQNPVNPTAPPPLWEGDFDSELEQLLMTRPAAILMLRTGRAFNQITDFDWINKDIRQLNWLIDHVTKGLNLDIPDARAKFSDRDYFICLIDLIALPVVDKRHYLSGLHRSWMDHLKNTSYLNWFSGDDEPERCDFSWKILDSRLKSTLLDSIQLDPIVGQEFRKYPGGVGLKCYFDSLQASDYEKKSHVDHIKKLWSQKKYREKLEKNKVRQRNFVLSDATMKNLDKLAKGLGMSRTEALERLITLAARHGMPGAQAGSDATPHGAGLP